MRRVKAVFRNESAAKLSRGGGTLPVPGDSLVRSRGRWHDRNTGRQ